MMRKLAIWNVSPSSSSPLNQANTTPEHNDSKAVRITVHRILGEARIIGSTQSKGHVRFLVQHEIAYISQMIVKTDSILQCYQIDGANEIRSYT